MKKKNFRGFFAFSMIELLIAIIIISLLTSALAPVVTRKLTKQSVSVGSSSNITSNCSEAFSSDCTFCEGNIKCYVCAKICQNGEFKNTDTCTCKPCNELDENCSLCEEYKGCTFCKDRYYLENKSCIICPVGYQCKNNNKTVCPDGKYSNEGSSSCTNCEAGYACKNGNKTYCQEGSYSLSGASECTACPSGYYCSGGSNKVSCPSNCLTCSSASTCTNCQSGYDLSNGSCKARGPAHCLESTSSGACTDCEYGYDLEYGNCFLPCPSGYVFWGQGSDTRECAVPDTYTGYIRPSSAPAYPDYCCVSVPSCTIYASGEITFTTSGYCTFGGEVTMNKSDCTVTIN